jgi:hypothetical protein
VRSITSLAYSEYRISAMQATSMNRIQQLLAQLQPDQSISPHPPQQAGDCGEPVERESFQALLESHLHRNQGKSDTPAPNPESPAKSRFLEEI